MKAQLRTIFAHSQGAIHSTKIPAGPTGKSGPPKKVDPFLVVDRNFRKFWLNGSRPQTNCISVPLVLASFVKITLPSSSALLFCTHYE